MYIVLQYKNWLNVMLVLSKAFTRFRTINNPIFKSMILILNSFVTIEIEIEILP